MDSRASVQEIKNSWMLKTCVPWQQAVRNRKNLKAAFKKQPREFRKFYKIMPMPGSTSAEPLRVSEFLKLTCEQGEDVAEFEDDEQFEQQIVEFTIVPVFARGQENEEADVEEDDDEEYIPDPSELIMTNHYVYPLDRK